MKIVARILAALVGITGLIQIAIGILFWTGHALPLIPLHMTIGIVFVAAMWILGGLGFRAHLAMRSSIILAWSLVVMSLGMTQMQLFPGVNHWVVRVLHLLVGLIAMTLAGQLGARIAAFDAVSHPSRPAPLQARS